MKLNPALSHPLPDEDSFPDPTTRAETSNAVLPRHWRQEILNRTWHELQRQGGAGATAGYLARSVRHFAASSDPRADRRVFAFVSLRD